MEKHSVARQSGAPPRVVDDEDAGKLTVAVCRREYSIALSEVLLQPAR